MTGVFLLIQATRFKNFHSKTPGPGSYNLSKKSDWLKETPVKADLCELEPVVKDREVMFI